jgi:hypothetical protein
MIPNRVHAGASSTIPQAVIPIFKQRVLCSETAQQSVQRAPDYWDSPRFQASFLSWSWFWQSGVISSHPPAGNAPRWATLAK